MRTALPDTKPSPRGEGAPKGRIGQERYEKERRRSSQVGDIDERGIVSSTPLTKAPYPPLARSPFPDGEGKEEAAPPHLLEDRLKYTVYESTLSTAGAVLLPRWGRQRGGGFAAKKEANPASLRSAAPSKGRGSRGHSLLPMEGGAPKGRRLDGGSGIPDTKPSPRGEGGERNEPDRVLAV